MGNKYFADGDSGYTSAYGPTTDYIITGPDQDGSGLGDAAEVSVKSPYTRYGYDVFKGYHANHYERNPEASPRDYTIDKTRYTTGDGPDGQQSLYDVTHTKPYVSYMAAHPDMRGYIPSLLGLAALKTQARFREPLQADSDLSEQSSRLVRRAVEAGAVAAPENEHRNNFSTRDWSEFARPVSPSYGAPISHIDMSQGRQFIRAALRRPTKTHDTVIGGISTKDGIQQELF